MEIKFRLKNGSVAVFSVSSHWLKYDFRISFDAVVTKDGRRIRAINPCDESDYFYPSIKLSHDSTGKAVIDVGSLKQLKFRYYDDSAGHYQACMAPDFCTDMLYFRDYEKMTMAEFVEQFTSGRDVHWDEFAIAAIRDGVHNIRVVKPCMRLSNLGLSFGIGIGSPDDTQLAMCRISETYNRDLLDGYKINLVPVSPVTDTAAISGRSYYTSDFINLMKRSQIFKIAQSEGDQSWDHTREYFESHGYQI